MELRDVMAEFDKQFNDTKPDAAEGNGVPPKNTTGNYRKPELGSHQYAERVEDSEENLEVPYDHRFDEGY